MGKMKSIVCVCVVGAAWRTGVKQGLLETAKDPYVDKNNTPLGHKGQSEVAEAQIFPEGSETK